MTTFVRNYDDLSTPHQDITVIDFYASWCAPCRAFAPVYERVAGELGDSVTFTKADVDQNPDLAKRFHVSSIPTLIILNKGQVVSHASGALSYTALKTYLQSIFNKLGPST